MIYNRLGNSGLLLPALSLGMWHNFGSNDLFDESRNMILHAFENGITHFDLANNYGPPPGSAELTFGKILKQDLNKHRDHLLISTKAGWDMWDGPYGDLGSKKHLRASIDQSLRRLGVEYVDVFYHHRPDPQTPLEETMMALCDFVKQGKALYLGVCGYSPEMIIEAKEICSSERVPLIAYQASHSILFSQYDSKTSQALSESGMGSLGYCPLFQGVLTAKYLDKVPEGSRMDRSDGHLKADHVNHQMLDKVKELQDIASSRGQSLAEMSLAWTLQHPSQVSTIIGTRTLEQLKSNLKCLDNLDFTPEELAWIEKVSE